MVGKGEYTAEDWFDKGLELHDSGKLEEAIECYDKALKINPLYEGAWGNKGTCLDSTGRYSNALECYDKVLEINPKSYMGWYSKGNTLHKLDRHEEAIRCYDESIKINPDHYGSWNNKGNCLAILERYEEAFICFDKAIGINPSEESAWALKGTWLDKIDRSEEAIQYYDETLKINPNLANIWFKNAFCIFASNEGDSNEGKEKCASKLGTAIGLGLPPEDEVNARALLGYSYERLGKYSDAKRELERAKETDDQSDKEILGEDIRKELLHTPLAFCYAVDATSLREEGNVDEAIEVANKAIQLDNGCNAAHIVLGDCYFNQEKWNSAISEYNKVSVDALPLDLAFNLHNNLGVAYIGQDNIDSGIKELEKALEIDPNASKARELLSMAIAERNGNIAENVES